MARERGGPVHQAARKLEAGAGYQDGGLIFTNELGAPLSANNIGQREFRALIAQAGVPVIRFHDLRHTAATLMLKAGISVKVVAERLGHRDTSITQDISAHVLPAPCRRRLPARWKPSCTAARRSVSNPLASQPGTARTC